MEHPSGRVLAVNQESPSAVVEVAAGFSCARCAAGKGCGAGIFGRRGQSRIEAALPAGHTVEPGDIVKIALLPRQMLRAAGIVYGWPLVGAALGAALGFGLGDTAAVLSALAGLAAGLGIARWRLRRSGCLAEFTPEVVGSAS